MKRPFLIFAPPLALILAGAFFYFAALQARESTFAERKAPAALNVPTPALRQPYSATSPTAASLPRDQFTVFRPQPERPTGIRLGSATTTSEPAFSGPVGVYGTILQRIDENRKDRK